MVEPFKLEANAKREDGTILPFFLCVSQPSYDEARGFYWIVDCPILREKVFKIFGVDEEQAMALALWFVEDQLKHHQYTLVDAKGETIQLPIDRDAMVPS